jgi:phosphoadenosine phosphosulfate reductase
MTTHGPSTQASPLSGPFDVAALAARFANASPFELLSFALTTYGDGLRIACSFGVEDMVVLHEAARAGKAVGVAPRVFLLDTGRLHQETYDLLDRALNRYGKDGVVIEAFFPETVGVEDLVRRQGPNGFYSSVDARKECCAVRKLGPLTRALAGARAWVTGLRREQSPTRAGVDVVEVDAQAPDRLKLNPLAAWSEAEVWAFAKTHDVPTHALHAQGFPSIGCAPCTRAVQPGEDVRAGRWWWESPDHKECGLHARGRRQA